MNTCIPLTRGLVALVDADDAVVLSAYRWHAIEAKPGLWYAARRARGRYIYMHREVLGHPDGLVDHRNGDGLDNRRANLRLANHALNNCNTRKRAGTTSRYKGVSRHRGAWRARITPPGGQQATLGRFESEAEAALAYDAAARRLFGRWARLNFPRAGEEAAA